MRIKLSFLILLLLIIIIPVLSVQDHKTIGTIYRDTPEFDKLVPKDAEIEVLAEGFDWSEGPVWLKDKATLLFNDIPQNTTYQWREHGGLTVFLRPAGYSLGTNPPRREPGSNGMYVHPRTGNVVSCDHGNRCLTVLDQNNWTKKVLVREYKGKRLNSPNDVVISSKGHYYFTDPPYGLSGPDYPGKELDFSGIFHLTPDGQINLVSKDLDRPNGIGLAPDEKTLYVANSGHKKIWLAFDIKEDGTTANQRIFYDASNFKQYGNGGGCDGLAVDAKGNIWATGPGGVMVFTPEGKHLGSINTGTSISNCCFGGAEGSELFITADMYLCRIKLNIKGAGF